MFHLMLETENEKEECYSWMLLTVSVFFITSVTNYHIRSGLTQHKFTLLQFWRPEIQHRFYWAKNQSVGRVVFFLEAPE